MACIENNAQTAKKKFTVLLDGVIGPPVDVLIDTSADAWRFISNNVLVFPAISGEELVSFRVRLPAGEMTAFNERAVSQSTTATNQPATNAPPSNAPPSNQPPPATGDSLGSIKDKVNDLKKKIRIFGSKP